MAFCTECGATIADGKQFCTSCGKPMKAAKTRSQKATTATAVAEPPRPVQAAPVYAGGVQGPPQGSPYAVMSTGSYVLASIIMSIPVIGWIIGIIWACGVCKNLNRRNYARSFLIFLLVGLVLSLIAYLLAGWATSYVQRLLPGFGLPGSFGTPSANETSGSSAGLQEIFQLMRQLGDLMPAAPSE